MTTLTVTFSKADELLARLLIEPWGRVTPSVYETGRLVTLAPWLSGHRERIAFLLGAQRPDGGWGGPDRGYALVPTLSAVEALLGAGEYGAARRGLDRLWKDLADLGATALPDMPAIELIVPALLGEINARLADPGAPGPWNGAVLHPPAGITAGKLDLVRALVAAGGELPAKLHHALEVAGPVATGAGGVRPEPTGTIGASPAATAAWLGEHEPGPLSAARRYLEAAVRPHGGPAPVAIPITVFERGWVVSWLLRAGVPAAEPPGALVDELSTAIGAVGTPAAAGLPADADTTAGALYALALLGAPLPPDPLLAYETDTHFCTWQGEDGESVTTNAHVLEALGSYTALRPGERYAAATAKAAGRLVERQDADGSWHDRWHASPLYATSCAAIALHSYGGPAAVPAVRAALRWLLETRRPDGSWGVWGSTAEETAYAVQTLALGADTAAGADRAAVAEAVGLGAGWLRRHPGSRADPALWHDKDLYRPTAIVRAAELASLHLSETATL